MPKTPGCRVCSPRHRQSRRIWTLRELVRRLAERAFPRLLPLSVLAFIPTLLMIGLLVLLFVLGIGLGSLRPRLRNKRVFVIAVLCGIIISASDYLVKAYLLEYAQRYN